MEEKPEEEFMFAQHTGFPHPLQNRRGIIDTNDLKISLLGEEFCGVPYVFSLIRIINISRDLD
jgi:hypothetical protein